MSVEREPRERPILFNDEMVRAILDGRKTQTRRVIKCPAKVSAEDFIDACSFMHERGTCGVSKRGPCDGVQWHLTSPYGVPGDRLWVREAWAIKDCGRRVSARVEDWDTLPRQRLQYRATDEAPYFHDNKPYWWNLRPSIHMPRWASRITMEVTGVRVERVRDISEEDAEAEGITPDLPSTIHGSLPSELKFAELWDTTTKPGFKWDDNPWVWVVEFKLLSEAKEES